MPSSQAVRLTTPTLLLVRHGSTDLNSSPGTSPERIRGWVDVPLNDEGHTEAADVAKDLARLPIRAVITTDLSRGLHTAQHVAQATKAPMEATHSLRPWNLGSFQGQPVEATLKQVLSYQMDYPEVNVPNGESFNSFLQRFLPRLWYLMQEAQRDPGAGIIVVVTHTRNLRAAEAWIKAGMPAHFTIPRASVRQVFDRPSQVQTGGVLVVTKENGRWSAEPVEEDAG